MPDRRSNSSYDTHESCRLCGGSSKAYVSRSNRDYLRCPSCGYVQVSAPGIPDSATERERYLLHDNDPGNSGYVSYLTRFAEQTVYRCAPVGSSLLEVGSGPSPVLAGVLTTAGYVVRTYDPYFAPNESVFEAIYDGVLAVEVAEHVQWPAPFFERIVNATIPGGWIWLRTELWEGPAEAFARWWYKEDVTHIGFFSAQSIRLVAEKLHLEIVAIESSSTITLRRRTH